MLVFEPGFSTAKQVTDISGRGVGMDVVKKNIEKLRGSIDVESKYGKGSKFTLRIPLTLAILDAMLIRIGASIFALPILSVSESFRTELSTISETMDGLEMVKIREEIIPVVRLHELYKKNPDSKNIDNGVLIIAESRDRKLALFADEIVGQQQAVIKGFSQYIGKVPGITGCMILGDGGIGLIIDIEGLFDMAENKIEFANVEQYL
jgi:two-component system chemotaxis sensor kinase CheA